jgi:hypothetical protein
MVVTVCGVKNRTVWRPATSEEKRTSFPSGEKAGALSLLLSLSSCCSLEPPGKLAVKSWFLPVRSEA